MPLFPAHTFKGVIFDFDGTLAETALDFAAMRAETGCPEGVGLLEYLQTLPPDLRSAAAAAIDRHEHEGAARAAAFPGVVEFLELLRTSHLPRAILTRNSSRAMEIALSALGWNDFAPVISREDAAPKPDPAGLLLICAAWEVSPTEVLFIGDYAFDLEAGRRAGMPTALFTPVPRDFEADPAYEFTSFHELVEAWRSR